MSSFSNYPESPLSLQDPSRAGVAARLLFYLFTMCASLTAMQILFLALESPALNIALSLAIIIGIPLSLRMPTRVRPYMIYLGDFTALGVLLFYAVRISMDRYSWGNNLGYLLGMFLAIYAFRLFEHRDHLFTLLIGTVFLLLASVSSFDIRYVFYLPGYLFFALGTLFFGNVSQLSESVLLPTLGRRIIGSLTRLFFVLTTAVFIVAVLIYIFVPHRGTLRNPNFAVPRSTLTGGSADSQDPEEIRRMLQESTWSGFSDRFDLSSGARIVPSDRLDLTVKTTKIGYLRGMVFDYYDGKGWTVSENEWSFYLRPALGSLTMPLFDFPTANFRVKRFLERKQIDIIPSAFKNTIPKLVNTYSINANKEVNYELVLATVTFESDNFPVYFTIFQPSDLFDLPRTSLESFAPIWIFETSVVRSDSERMPKHPEGMSYSFSSLVPTYTMQDLAASGAAYPRQIKERYLQLPDKPPISTRVRSLAQTLTRGRKTQLDKALAIQNYLLNNFKYTTDYPSEPTKEATDFFIFETGKGYCQYFASAMAVLLRIAGIPARVVTGYAPPQKGMFAQTYKVISSNAHAWVEVYFDGFGWIPFDPTPSSTLDIRSPGLIARIRSLWERTQDLFIVDPQSVVAQIGDGLKRLSTRTIIFAADNFYYLIGAIILLVILAFFAQRRRAAKLSRAQAGRGAARLYLSFVDLFSKRGINEEPSQTGIEYGREVTRRYSRLSGLVERFLSTLYLVLYAAAHKPELETEASSALKDIEKDLETYDRYLESKFRKF